MTICINIGASIDLVILSILTYYVGDFDVIDISDKNIVAY